MKSLNPPPAFLETIQHNCDISDARDHGVYSMCTMVLKLRNLFKWENGLQPWEEPAATDLLDWIEAKETFWATIEGEAFSPLVIAGKALDPFQLEAINGALTGTKFIYGSGFGRSMKTIFFLAETIESREIEGCPVIILGKEFAREMASPFAMVQDGLILIRKESLRFFLWDQIQEVRASCRNSIHQALRAYPVFRDGVLDQELLKATLDTIVEKEMSLFVYHEVGEILQTTLNSDSLQMIVSHFPGTVIEFVGRAVKDLLADTHPQGLLAYLAREQRESSLGFYLSFADGLRQRLFPEIMAAWPQFLADRDWRHVEQARIACWDRNQVLAEQIRAICSMIGNDSDELIISRFNRQVLSPLGLAKPA